MNSNVHLPSTPQQARIGIIGLGYVGLPLAIAFAEQFSVIGLDASADRVSQLKAADDHSGEVEPKELRQATALTLTTDASELRHCNVYIVTVPTPICSAKKPDFEPLEQASRTVGALLSAGDVVIYESTVYPGATEEICVPILEQVSGLEHNQQFFSGYSPERINPGNKTQRLTDIKKLTSGSTPEAATFVDQLYRTIITAGTHLASSIRVAEAAKVVENTQRDVNIALMNELALIFEPMGLDTVEVLEAAGSKWNFLPFRPGLVGGHCIGVDPYYLAHKAETIGHHPEIIHASRRVNDSMGRHVASRLVKLMSQKGINIAGSRILVMGITFKENCPDVRNSRVIDVINKLESYTAQVDVYDPWADRQQTKQQYQITPIDQPEIGCYDAILVTIAHQQFLDLGAKQIRTFAKPGSVLYDVKSLFPAEQVDGRL